MSMEDRTRVESSDDELKVESINKGGGGGGGGGDRISDLCDELLHHIFSFLPTRNVVQACVLSKRWRNLWCSIPWLDFDEEPFLASSSSSSLHAAAGGSSFCTFVNYALLLRDASSNIQKLSLSCSSSSDNTTTSSSSSSNHVFQYIVAAALKHNLQLLDLKILQHHQEAAAAAAAAIDVLPPSLFTCDSLTCLKLNNVVLPSSSSICLSSLKTLHLISVKFPSDQLSTYSLFSNSRNLETLTIHNCNFEHLKLFHISALKLKNLIIIQDEAPPPSSTNNTPSSLTNIYAPNLISLKLHVDLESRWYLLHNLNSLVEADIHIKKSLMKHIPFVFMIGIFSQLLNAKAVTLSGSCLKLIGKVLIVSVETIINARFHRLRLRFMGSKENPFPNLKSMKLKTWFEDEEVGVITGLLKRSPNIETLVIEYNSESSYEENELLLREEKLSSECTLHHLKTIQMRGFGGRKNEVKLLSFLLENAESLKKTIESGGLGGGGFHIGGGNTT